MRVPPPVDEHVVKPIARFFDPRVFASYDALKLWIRDGDHFDMEDHEVPEYDEEDLKRAYLHPALTSQTPVIWMARDPMGASQNEIHEIKEYGLKASDEGAWLDEKRRIQWSMLDFDKVPVWKQGVKY
jgi:hypothetical protein